MTAPKPWSDPSSDAPDGVRELLQHAHRSQPMSAADHAAASRFISKLVAAPAGATAAWLSGKTLALLTGVGVAGVLAALTISPRPRSADPRVAPRAEAQRVESPATRPVTRAPVVVASARAQPAASRSVVTRPTPPALPAPIAPVVRAAHAANPPRTGAPNPAPVAGVRAPTPTVPAAVPNSPPVAATAAPDNSASAANTTSTADTSGSPHGGIGATATQDPEEVENRWVDEVSRQVDGNPAGALARLDRLRSVLPRTSSTAQDREFLAITALHRLNRTSEARTRADAMFAQFPRSPFARRIRRMLGDVP